jgi:glycosyltransferase involved in cell wall biosynthesis
MNNLELSIVMPCLNEAKSIAASVAKARSFLNRSGIVGEIVVADNGSTDRSQAIAEANGARVVNVPERGYGSALIGGIRAARGTYVVMGDSDGSHDLSLLEPFVETSRGLSACHRESLSGRYPTRSNVGIASVPRQSSPFGNRADVFP